MTAKFCIQNVYKKFVEIWYTFCIHTFCIQFLQINSAPQKLYIKNFACNLYAKFIQNVYTNNCMQRSHISTYFDPFVVHFLAS